MSNDEPTPGQQPEDDPFLKKPQGPPRPEGPPSWSADGPPSSGPYGARSPYSAGGGNGNPPPYRSNAYGGDPFGNPDPLYGMPPLASFGQRLTARIADVLIVFIPLLVLSLIVGAWNWSSDGDDWDEFSNQFNSGRQWLWSLISIIAYVGYDALMTQRTGQTLGKRWMKLRVAMLNNGDVPNGSASFMRAAVLWLPALLCFFCVWWAVIIVSIVASRPYKQGLHDKAARTVVVSAAQ
jgi:uncharacterized RDD family membrane protein YckC